MSFVDIFNFDASKINFGAPVTSNSQDGSVSYQKVYYTYGGDSFYFEIPSLEIVINSNSKKKYEAYSCKLKMSTCKQADQVIDVFNKIYESTAKYIELNKAKLNFKNKNKFKAEKAEECGLSSPLYYIIDKETGERSSKYPLIYANMVLDNKNKSILKYPTGFKTFGQLEWKKYLGYQIVCIPIVSISNIFVGSDGSLRIQLQLKSATVKDIKEGIDLDQSQSFSKYGEEEIDFSNFKLPSIGSTSVEKNDENEIEDLDNLLKNE